MADSELDYNVLGDGEMVLPELTASLLKGRNGGKTLGLISRNDASINVTPEVTPAVIPDDSPVYNTKPGATPSSFLSKTLDISSFPGILWETSRGCPYKCSFCYESRGRKKTVSYPYDRLENELKFFTENDICRIFVLDPSFNANKKHAMKILELIQEHAPEIHFTFEIKGEELDEELAMAFGEINCYLQIGLQSSNPIALKNVDRYFNGIKFIEGCGVLHDHGVPFGLDLIYGLPGDYYKEFLTSMDYALSLKPQNLDIFPLAVLPGTPLEERAGEFGLEYNRKSPYLIESAPGFPKEDMKRAEILTKSADSFLSGGGTQYWFMNVTKSTGLTPSEFLSAYSEWVIDEGKKGENKKLSPDELRENFTKAILISTGNDAAVTGAISLIRLYNAITDVLDGCETSITKIHFTPDDLENADMVNLADFSTYFEEREQYWVIYQEDAELMFAEIKKPD